MTDAVDSDSDSDSPANDHRGASDQSHSHEPQFGIIDLVEAFTAMRHEWRNQSRENRELAQSISQSVTQIGQLEAAVDSKLQIAGEDARVKNLVSIIIELDISLQRAINSSTHPVNGITPSPDNRLIDDINLRVKQKYDGLGWLRRWLVRSFFTDIQQTISTTEEQESNVVLEGLQMMQLRLRTLMAEQHLVRTDTLGQPFNAETMNAISSVVSATCKPGNVAEEISPAYLYQSKLFKFAEVRVARHQAAADDNTTPEASS